MLYGNRTSRDGLAPVRLAALHHRPHYTGYLVGQRDSGQFARPTLQQLQQPLVRANRMQVGTSIPILRVEVLMPGSYSKDLRERVLVAVEAGEAPETVAERFMIGRSTVYRWAAMARTEGRRAAKPMIGGPKPLIRDAIEAALLEMLKENNHLTLAECRDA